MSVLKDVLTGALPVTEIPSYVWYVITKHIGFTFALLAMGATRIVFIVTH